MKVILAGLPKCGTKTMVSAFESLGYEVCDYIESYELLADEWEEVFDDGGSTQHFRRMFENIDVITDAPGCYYWEEILAAFPDVKV